MQLQPPGNAKGQIGRSEFDRKNSQSKNQKGGVNSGRNSPNLNKNKQISPARGQNQGA